MMYFAGKDINVELYISIGIASSTIRKGRESRMQEGPAFYLSRQGMDILKKSKSRRTMLLTQSKKDNEFIDLILGYQDMLLLSWTLAQWQAIRLRDLDFNLKEIGKKLGVAYQNVQKRLKAANWDQYNRGREFIAGLLKSTPSKG